MQADAWLITNRAILVIQGLPSATCDENGAKPEYDALTNAWFLDSIDLSPSLNATSESQRVQAIQEQTVKVSLPQKTLGLLCCCP